MPDVEEEALELLQNEFRDYLSGKKAEKLKGYKKQAAPGAPGEEKCEACERGECDNPEHMDESAANGLSELLEDLAGHENGLDE